MNLIREEVIRHNIYNNKDVPIKVQVITTLKYQYVDVAEFEEHCKRMEAHGFTLDRFTNENVATLDKPEYQHMGEYFAMQVYNL